MEIENKEIKNYSKRRLINVLMIFATVVIVFVILAMIDQKTAFLSHLAGQWFGKYLGD